jgi:hypothetical protein
VRLEPALFSTIENNKKKETDARLVDARSLNPSASSLRMIRRMPPLHLLLHSVWPHSVKHSGPAVSRGRCNCKAALGNDKPLKGWLRMFRPGAIPLTSSNRRQRHRSDLAANGRHPSPPPLHLPAATP